VRVAKERSTSKIGCSRESKIEKIAADVARLLIEEERACVRASKGKKRDREKKGVQ
jgi:hypothetical protein